MKRLATPGSGDGIQSLPDDLLARVLDRVEQTTCPRNPLKISWSEINQLRVRHEVAGPMDWALVCRDWHAHFMRRRSVTIPTPFSGFRLASEGPTLAREVAAFPRLTSVYLGRANLYKNFNDFLFELARAIGPRLEHLVFAPDAVFIRGLADWGDAGLEELFTRARGLRTLVLPNPEVRIPEAVTLLTALERLECPCILSLPKALGYGTLGTTLRRLWLSGRGYFAASYFCSLPASFTRLTALQDLKLTCSYLKKLPPGFSALSSLREFHLKSEDLEDLPPDCFSLVGPTLRSLRIECKSLRALPPSMSCLTNLELLRLPYPRRSTPLGQGPSPWHFHFSSLKRLELHSAIYTDPHLRRRTVSLLPGVESLSLPRLSSLVMWEPNETTPLQLGHCQQLRTLLFPAFPDASTLQELPRLRFLEVGDVPRLPELSQSFGCLSSLERLHMSGCQNLQELPPTLSCLVSLRELRVTGCHSLAGLPPQVSCLQRLRQLHLKNLTSFSQFPRGIGSLHALKRLTLMDLPKLRMIPQGRTSEDSSSISGSGEREETGGSMGEDPFFLDLYHLDMLIICGCRSLRTFPASFSRLWSLTCLILSDCRQLRHLPEDLGRLPALCTLVVKDCKALAALPQSMGLLSRLRCLRLEDLPELSSLPDSITRLTALCWLSFNNCRSLRAIPASLINGSSMSSRIRAQLIAELASQGRLKQ